MPQNFTADLTAVKFPSFLHPRVAHVRAPSSPAVGARCFRARSHQRPHKLAFWQAALAVNCVRSPNLPLSRGRCWLSPGASGGRSVRQSPSFAHPLHACPHLLPHPPSAERLRRLPLNPVSPVGSACERPILDRCGTRLRSAAGANPRIRGCATHSSTQGGSAWLACTISRPVRQCSPRRCCPPPPRKCSIIRAPACP